MGIDMDVHRQRFLDYTERFVDVPDAAPLRLKTVHTFRVYEHARTITASLGQDRREARFGSDTGLCRAAELAALYHDCGRFPQFKRYRTFLDAASVDHALLSFKTMRDEGLVKEEPGRVRGLAQCAVLLHNRHILPQKLSAEARFVTDVVRDADKLDIFRIMVEHLQSALPEKDAVLLHVKEDPDCWTPRVFEDVMAGRVARYSDLRYVNDFRLLLGTWMFELRFAATRHAVAASGLMDAVLDGLPRKAGLMPALDVLYSRLEACRRDKGEAF